MILTTASAMTTKAATIKLMTLYIDRVWGERSKENLRTLERKRSARMMMIDEVVMVIQEQLRGYFMLNQANH